MSIRDKIESLKNVRNALASQILPISQELLIRLEAVGVNLVGYKNYEKNVPIKENEMNNKKQMKEENKTKVLSFVNDHSNAA